MTPQKETQSLKIKFDNLTLHVKTGIPCVSRNKKLIISNLSGLLKSGTLTAILGPSGSGKTTLLNCLAGKTTAISSGRISILCDATCKEQIRIGFVPQKDGLFMQFTVRETIMFASRMNNPSFSAFEHDKRVEETIDSLDMMSLCHSRLTGISGGELKRTSIAIELVSRPAILMLDEPTTGLDSDNSESVVSVLKKMTTMAFAPLIVATIHQPSHDTFLMFNHVYFLNKDGTNIYAGPPGDVMRFITGIGLKERTNMNPADYMIEISNGKHGKDIMKKVTTHTSENVTIPDPRTQVIEIPIAKITQKVQASLFSQFYLLTKRRLIADLLKSQTFSLHLCLGILSTLILCYIPAERIGKFSGCWNELFITPHEDMTEVESLKQLLFGSNDGLPQTMASSNVYDNNDRIQASIIFFFLLGAFNLLTPIITVVTYYPSSNAIIMRELSNHWYSIFPVFVSIVVCETMLVLIFTTTITLIAWFASGFPNDQNQFFYTLAVMYLIALIWAFRGIVFSLLFAPYTIIALLATISIALMDAFTSGFFLKDETLTPLMHKVSQASDVKYFVAITMISAFGFDRCKIPGDVSAHIVHEVLRKKSVIRLTAGIWPIFNVMPEDLKHIASRLKLPDNYFDILLPHLAEFIGTRDDAELDPLPSYDASYVLDFQQISQADVGPSFVFLIISCSISCLLILLTLLIRSKRSRL